jgi:hypothetical protein
MELKLRHSIFFFGKDLLNNNRKTTLISWGSKSQVVIKLCK